MPKIPKFKNENEEAEFWVTHSITDYMDEMVEINAKIVVTAKKTPDKVFKK